MSETQAATATLYERLGGPGKIAAIASDLVDAHMVNPLMGQRFQKIDEEAAEAARI
mgnify:FL=1